MLASAANGLEEAFLTQEIRSGRGNVQIGGLVRFSGVAPSFDDFRGLQADRLRALPRLGLALRREGRRWHWDEVTWDPEHQIKAITAARGGLAEAAAEVMAGRYTRGRPPWELWLIRGYADDEWAVVFKTHHALLDGASHIRVMHHLLGVPAGEAVTTPIREVRKPGDLKTVAKGIARYFHKFLPIASRPIVTRGWTGVRTFSWVTVELDRLERLAAEHQVPVNDLFLSATASALREWRHTPWRHGKPSPMWTLVPVNLSARDGGGGLGNRVISMRLPLPCHLEDPRQRLAEVTRWTSTGKGDGRLAVGGASFRSMPRRLVKLVAEISMSRWQVGLIASNVRGPERVLDYEGMPVCGLVPLGFIPPGQLFSAYLMTCHDKVCVGFAVDSSLPKGDELGRLWLSALAELESGVEVLARHRTPAGVR